MGGNNSSRLIKIVSFSIQNSDVGNCQSPGVIHLVDGSGTEFIESHPTRDIVEARMLNRSLQGLRNCVNAIIERKMYVPFRDSKLSRILQEALKTQNISWIIAVSPYQKIEYIRESLIFGYRIATHTKQRTSICKSA